MDHVDLFNNLTIHQIQKKQGTDCQQVQELQPNPGTPKFGVVFSKTSWWLNQPIWILVV